MSWEQSARCFLDNVRQATLAPSPPVPAPFLDTHALPKRTATAR
jgi:hypothetical protein